MAKRQTLDSWIAECMTDDEKDGPISNLVLLHLAGSQVEIDHVKLVPGGKKWSPSELSMRFRGKAESYCQDLPGAQTFNLLAFYSRKDEVTGEYIPCAEPEGRHPFTLMGEGMESGGLLTEAPTDKGATMQTMRHLEVQFSETNKILRAFADRSSDMLTMCMTQMGAQQRELTEAHKVIRELYLSDRAGEHKNQLEMVSAERTNLLLEKMLAHAPALINTIFGKEILPQASADTLLFEGIIKSLRDRPGEVQKLLELVPPESQGLLMARLEQILAGKMQAEQNSRRALAGTAGEADAAGELTP